MSSLLPQQIPPQTVRMIGPDGKVDKNWWLFFYNIAQNSIGQQVDAGALLVLLENQIDSDQVTQTVQSAGFEDVDYPVLLPPEALLFTDPQVAPANQAQPEISVTVGLSPVTYIAPFNGWTSITAGTVTKIEVSRSGTFRDTGITVGFVPLARGDQVRITYSGLPTVFFYPS